MRQWHTSLCCHIKQDLDCMRTQESYSSLLPRQKVATAQLPPAELNSAQSYMLGMGKWATDWPSDMSRRHTGQLNFLEFQLRIQPLWNIWLQGSTVTLGFQPSLSLLGCLASRSLRQTAHSVGASLPNFDMHASRCSRYTAARSLHSWDPLHCFESSCISRALHSGSKVSNSTSGSVANLQYCSAQQESIKRKKWVPGGKVKCAKNTLQNRVANGCMQKYSSCNKHCRTVKGGPAPHRARTG